MNLLEHCTIPVWPAPARVHALQTTRKGGVSIAPYDTFNLGVHVGDNTLSVQHNRALLDSVLPGKPIWLEQVHGKLVANADLADCVPYGHVRLARPPHPNLPPFTGEGANESLREFRFTADACIARQSARVCAVMTADCLPVLLCDKQGMVVGAVHAGWKGLAAGIIEATTGAMNVPSQNLMAWLGPAISQEFFEVGDEVRAVFVANDSQAASAFIPGQSGKWFADIHMLAKLRLSALGVTQVYGGEYCTYRERERFFSYRRDRVSGRMGTFIWLE